MANPRQRNNRSGSYTAVKQSRRAKKNLRKQPAVKGSKLLQEAWDKKKTVRQNYEALGLVHTLNPIAQGGVEKDLSHPKVEPVPARISPKPPSKLVPQGHGRIIRDERGVVLRVELPDTEQDPGTSHTKSRGGEQGVWGDAMDDSDEEAKRMIPLDASTWVKIGKNTLEQDSIPTGLGINQMKGKRELVTALEKLSAPTAKAQRHASMHELAWLRDLVAVHGRDVDAMARDLKRNVWQKTLGEIKRA
ncbi:Ribosome biogenesis protein Nop16 [Ceratobasidium theobromae]|uniref:Nucleolar protein 16 n=1 Tax=Ceratobasidium theobromae TaxID=1582974 RepID=A0A5N5QVM9_9AGAM|nr:Ribosome biogenesis protein Nop16 [Ceratobasidium theobromae]